MLVQFDDPQVGSLERARAASALGLPSPVAIAAASSRFSNIGHTRELTRRQFPLTLSWALTIHKTQGLSLSGAVIDLGESICNYGQAYVALSRVRSLDGVALVAFSRAKLELVSVEVSAEYGRLHDKSTQFRQQQAGADAAAEVVAAPVAAAVAAAGEVGHGQGPAARQGEAAGFAADGMAAGAGGEAAELL